MAKAPYHLSYEEIYEFKSQLLEFSSKKLIWPSKSPFSALILFVIK
jgi:hypothetical protein